MDYSEIHDPLFRQAVAAIDTGDLQTLEHLLANNSQLVCQRIDYGADYFRQPYLLWFVAENPIRNGKLPKNIARITRVMLDAIERECANTLQEQIDYVLSLVCSGRVARECEVQLALIDVLVDAGASPDGALLPAIAHREVAAVKGLLNRGARLTLLAAICTGEMDQVRRLGSAARASERQLAFAAAAFYGQAETLAFLTDLGVDVNAFSPDGFHSHATPLHHAVNSGSLDAIKVLVKAGAKLDTRDRVHQGTPLDWAEHLEHKEIVNYLRGK